MLHIRYNSKGETVYGFSRPKTKVTDSPSQTNTVIPKVPLPPYKQRKDFDIWKKTNLVNLHRATEFILEGLQHFLVQNPHYSCSLNQEKLHDELHDVLYKASHNSLKNYMRLAY